RVPARMGPACAQACPSQSMQCGPVKDLRERAGKRVAALQAAGQQGAYVYGKQDILGGLNSFYLLLDKPEVYGLPSNPQLPSRNLVASSALSVASGLIAGPLGLRA